MLRNREVRVLLLAMSLTGLCLAAEAAFFSAIGSGIVILTSVLLIFYALIFTKWRYKQLAGLASYLQQISNGDFELDVRDNQEGELSLLKNHIYKVTVRLSEQNALLLKDKDHLKNAISDISHQIKTPLTSMTAMTDLLSDPDMPEVKRIEFTHKISVQLERIDWLVSSLLKLSKIDAGTVEFRKDRINVGELIRKAVQSVLVPIDIKGQVLSITGEEAVTFTGDLNWTSEALTNILKNCVEHTPIGGKLTIHYSENALYTEIVITDQGKGISKEELPQIFKRFYKGKNAGESSVGIGLSMSHSIILNQNGEIYATSERDQGTQFRIRFYKGIV